MIKDILADAEHRMKSALQVLHDDLAGVRTGRASPALVEKLPIEYYGNPTPQTSDLALNPNNDGKVIHLNLPPLNEERRRDLVKHVHHRLEESRIAVRNIRRDAHNDMRDFEKEKLISEDDLERGEEDLQKLTDKYVEEIGVQGKNKEAEIMEV